MRARDRHRDHPSPFPGTITTEIMRSDYGRIQTLEAPDWAGVYLSPHGLRVLSRRLDAMADAIETGANR